MSRCVCVLLTPGHRNSVPWSDSIQNDYGFPLLRENGPFELLKCDSSISFQTVAVTSCPYCSFHASFSLLILYVPSWTFCSNASSYMQNLLLFPGICPKSSLQTPQSPSFSRHVDSSLFYTLGWRGTWTELMWLIWLQVCRSICMSAEHLKRPQSPI